MRFYRRSTGTEVHAVQWTGLADQLSQVCEVGFELQASEGHRTGKALEVYRRSDLMNSVWIRLGNWAVFDPYEPGCTRDDPLILTNDDFQTRYETASSQEPEWVRELRHIAAGKKMLEAMQVSVEGSFTITRPPMGGQEQLVNNRVGEICGPNVEELINILAGYYRIQDGQET